MNNVMKGYQNMKHSKIVSLVLLSALLFTTACGNKDPYAEYAYDDLYESDSSNDNAVVTDDTVSSEKTETANTASDSIPDFGPLSEGLTYEGDYIWVNDKPEYAQLIEIMRSECTKTNFNKGVYILANDDEVIFLAGLNSTETDGITQVNPYTTYEAGALALPITAVAIYQLEEQEKLKLTDTIDKYLPEYEFGKQITINNLLYMQSGVYDYLRSPKDFWGDAYDGINGDFSDRVYNDEVTDEEFMQALNDSGFKHEPGGLVNYCITDYHLLAMIIENVTGESYADYVQKNIFDVCGMENSSAMGKGDITSVPDVNMGGDAKYIEMPNTLRGAWDTHSCAADVLAFNRALMSNRLLSGESKDKMLTSQKGYAIEIYAGGLFLADNSNAFASSGGVQSYLNLDCFIPDTGYGNLYLIDLESTLRAYYVSENISRRIIEETK